MADTVTLGISDTLTVANPIVLAAGNENFSIPTGTATLSGIV